MSELPLSQQAAPDSGEAIFRKMWTLYPAKGKERTVGLKANSKRKHGLTPMERCREATKVALQKINADILVGALEAYVERHGANEDYRYIKGLEWWLEQGQWEVEDVVSGSASRIEAKPSSGKSWRMAQGQVKVMLEAMKAEGCADDVLDGLFSDGIGLTHVNRTKGVPPTAVLRSNYGMNLWWRAASGFAERAGYNEYPYSPEYVEFARTRRSAEAGA